MKVYWLNLTNEFCCEAHRRTMRLSAVDEVKVLEKNLQRAKMFPEHLHPSNLISKIVFQVFDYLTLFEIIFLGFPYKPWLHISCPFPSQLSAITMKSPTLSVSANGKNPHFNSLCPHLPDKKIQRNQCIWALPWYSKSLRTAGNGVREKDILLSSHFFLSQADYYGDDEMRSI